jgi:hypothetical protein
MDFRHYPRVFRALRVERFNTRNLGASTARDSRANGKRGIPDYNRKGRR